MKYENKKSSNYWYNNYLTIIGNRYEIDSFIEFLTSGAKKDYHIRGISKDYCRDGVCQISFKILWFNPPHLLKDFMKPFPRLTFQLEYDSWYHNVHNYLTYRGAHLLDSFCGYMHDFDCYQTLHYEPLRNWINVRQLKTVSKNDSHVQKEGTLG